MAEKASFLDFAAWSSKTWVTALVAGLVALFLFLLLTTAFWAIVIGILVFLAAAWWAHTGTVPESPVTTTLHTPSSPRPTTPSPVPSPVTPAAATTTSSPTDPTAPASERPLTSEPFGTAATAPPVTDISTAAERGAGIQPTGLTGPREGGPDDLKRIKGVGPKLEELLHRLGFYHFDQIAAWTHEELAWVDTHLEGFNGRATRDDWIGQSKILAAGGETEHSRRVDRGEST